MKLALLLIFGVFASCIPVGATFDLAKSLIRREPECDCGGHGDCDYEDGESDDYFCNCRDGFTGEHCKTPPPPCDQSTCLNGGSCVKEGDNSWCACSGRYSGLRCEKDNCDDVDCENGECKYDKESDSFECICDEGYTGSRCEDEKERR